MDMDLNIQKANGKRTSSILEKYYLNGDYADFHFLIKVNEGDDEFERIPAHKILLAESDVFRTMFNGDWKEKNEVKIVDASVAVFKEFLQFFYLHEVNLTTENVGFVMNLGQKYNMSECLTVCSKFLTNSITDDNVCTAYGLATLFDQEELRKYCEIIIGNNTKAVLSSNGFMECDRKVLKHILSLDFISCSEADVFVACMNWVKFKSGEDHLMREIVQKQLGDLFQEFRFISMSLQEYALLLPEYVDIFQIHEVVEMIQLALLDGFKSNSFSDKKRNSFENFVHDGMKIECDRLISRLFSCEPYYIKALEITTFSVNNPVLLEDIVFSNISKYKNHAYYDLSEKLSTEFEIAQLSEQNDEQILCTQKVNHKIESDTNITLSKPILIRPNIKYEIRLKQSPEADYVTGSLVKSEVHIDSNIMVKFYEDPTVEGDAVARGLVRGLIFKKMTKE